MPALRPQTVRLNRSSPQARGLVGWWPHTGSAGGTLRDFSAVRNHGVIHASSSFVNKLEFGRVLKYTDAASEQTAVPNNPIYAPGNQLTYACWFFLTTLDTNLHPLEKNFAGQVQMSLELFSSPSGLLRCHVRAGGTNARAQFGSGTFTTGKWYHVVTTYDGANINAYMNGGEKVASSAAQTGNVDDVASDLNFGIDQDGSIAEVRIYNRALSTPEAAALYNPNTRWDLYLPIRTAVPWLKAPAAGADGAARLIFLTGEM